MKKIFGFFFSIFLAFLGTITFAEDIGYTIKNYQVDMQLNIDGSMDVQETINVNFSLSSRGIFREIPYYNDSGRYTIIQQLKANGDPYSSYDKSNYYAIRIGDANKYLIGDKTYHISYRVKNAIAGFGSGEDAWTELYRNIIGTERDTTIDKVNFALQLPKEVDFGTGEYYIVYGKKGEKKSNFSSITYTSSNRKIIGSLSAQLKDGEGLTIGVKFPANYFDLSEEYLAIEAPSKSTSTIQNIGNDGIYIGTDIHLNVKTILLVFLVIFGGFFLVVSFGVISSKDIGKVVVIGILFVAAILIFGKFGILFFLFLFLKNFLGKDQISIGKKYTSKTPITIYYTPPKNADILLSGAIYEVGGAKMLSSLIYYRASQGYIKIEQKSGKLFFITQQIYLISRVKTEKMPFAHEILLDDIIGSKPQFKLSDLSYQRYTKFLSDRSKGGKTKKSHYYTKKIKKFLGIFSYEVETLNEAGKDLYEQLRGFEHYLKKVEEPYLKQMLKEDPNYIDKMLPRAVMFGVETQFLKAVERIIGKLENPDRYSGTDRFSVAMMYSMASTIRSAATPPSSSGSGGGGSSGFGGGSSSGSSGGGGGGGGGGRR